MIIIVIVQCAKISKTKSKIYRKIYLPKLFKYPLLARFTSFLK